MKLTKSQIDKIVGEKKGFNICHNMACQCDQCIEAYIENKAKEEIAERLGKVEFGIGVCETCGGDGKETCGNPDHGFIVGMGGELGRLGCPVCGHDEDHKVPSGGDCEDCNGTGNSNILEVKGES